MSSSAPFCSRHAEPASPWASSPAPASRDWAALPRDILLHIFLMLGPCYEVMRGAERTCKAWRRAALEEPLLWRRVEMDKHTLLRAGLRSAAGRRAMARAAVDRAADQCEAFSACWDDVHYLAKRAPYLKRLNNLSHDGNSSEVLIKALKELSCLEDLEISPVEFTRFDTFLLQSVCRACPRLKKLKLKFTSDCAFYMMMPIDGRIPMMHELRFLELLGCKLNAMGLATVLENCPVLQYLRITGWFRWGEMDDELKAKCARVKNLILPGYNPLDLVHPMIFTPHQNI